MNASQRARRRARREKARLDRQRTHLLATGFRFSFDGVFSFRNLYRAARTCARGTLWKGGAMKFDRWRAANVEGLRRELAAGTYKRRPPVEFDLVERGKARHIVGPRYVDRVVQRCLCDGFLVPLVTRSLVYANSASVRGKGTSFARDRLGHDVRRVAARLASAGEEPCVFSWDVHDYFGSVPSDQAFAALRAQALRLVSGPRERAEAERVLAVAEPYVRERPHLTLGNQVNQLAAILYMSSVDHAVAEVARVGAQGRYMDDGYAVGEKGALRQVDLLVRSRLTALGLSPNPRHWSIVPVSAGVPYLKVVFTVPKPAAAPGQPVPKPSRRVCSSTLRRARRHLLSVASSEAAGTLPEGTARRAACSLPGVLSASTSRRFRAAALDAVERELASRLDGPYNPSVCERGRIVLS